VLLCFDGSANAARAIEVAGSLLAPAIAIVLTVWEPVRSWEPYDPGALLSQAVTRMGADSLGLDQIAGDLAREKADRGLGLAQGAGFDAAAAVEHGKPWRAICDAADEAGASVVVLGARGLSRVQSALLGSVSAAVVVHASRPVLVIPPPPS
jgi:nucleotide-binding universal stress UspA family protein